MASQEKFIDQYIESLRANRIDENTSTESLEKLITYFQVRNELKLQHSSKNIFVFTSQFSGRKN